MNKIDRIGEIKENNFGTKMKIIKYENWRNVIVEFQDEYKAKVTANYGNFKNGSIINPYDKTVWNIGYIGEGKYNCIDYSDIYKKWNTMLKRCYDPYYLNKRPTYRDCIVCEEWHNFQNFAKWYEENYYEIFGEKMELDKDILIKNCKIYSPQTCVFVPNKINILFASGDSKKTLPIGVFPNKLKFQARCRIYDYKRNKSASMYLGNFSTPEEAFLIYKNFKENHIKEVANMYKRLIPIKLYEAMYKYKIEIND